MLDTFICELVTANGTVVAEGRGARHRDQDYGDANKSLKMAAKSSQTDAVLRCAGLSEILTQDLEDMPASAFSGEENGGEFQAPRSKSGTPSAPAAAAPSLEQQLEESVRRTAPAPSRPVPAPRPQLSRPAPRSGPPSRPGPRGAAPAGAAAPSDALSPARVNRLMALLHE